MCQHDFAAKDDRDPSQNIGMAGQKHKDGRRGGQDKGPRTGDGTSGGLDGTQLVCSTDRILYDLTPHPFSHI